MNDISIDCVCCPYCLMVVKSDDTTCYNCGGEIKQTKEDDFDEENTDK